MTIEVDIPKDNIAEIRMKTSIRQANNPGRSNLNIPMDITLKSISFDDDKYIIGLHINLCSDFFLLSKRDLWEV